MRVNVCSGFIFLFAMVSCRDNTQHSQPSEAWDFMNRPELFGFDSMRYQQLTTVRASRGSLERKPWEDDYWAFTKKNLAFRYLEQSDFSSFDSQRENAAYNSANTLLSPAEKYDLFVNDEQFSLTRDGWSKFEYFSGVYPENRSAWDWMGICAGWAPAAFTEQAPQNHVLARNQFGREVLFFEGDIRALMSKSYDMNASTESPNFIGSRCNIENKKIPRDRNGRPLDGIFADTNREFYILNDYLRTRGILQISDDITKPGSYWLASRSPIKKLGDSIQVFVYRSIDSLQADLSEELLGRGAESQVAKQVNLYKNCRDVNPGALHLILSQSMSDAVESKQGFVIELERAHQVWNHPIWGFRSEIGMPRPLEFDDPSTRFLRSPGTTHLADVTTTIIYISEPSIAKMAYPKSENVKINWKNLNEGRHSIREFKYSLEFDASGTLIGGEWKEGLDGLTKTPDFMWRPRGTLTDTNRQGRPSILKYSLIKKLRDCSFNPPNTRVNLPISIGGASSVAAVECDL